MPRRLQTGTGREAWSRGGVGGTGGDGRPEREGFAVGGGGTEGTGNTERKGGVEGTRSVEQAGGAETSGRPEGNAAPRAGSAPPPGLGEQGSRAGSFFLGLRSLNLQDDSGMGRMEHAIFQPGRRQNDRSLACRG